MQRGVSFLRPPPPVCEWGENLFHIVVVDRVLYCTINGKR